MRRVDRKPMSRAMAMRGLLLPSPRNPRPRSGPPAARRRRVRTCMPACVRFLQAACGLACGPARAACRPACGFARPDSAAPTPLLPLRIGSLADGELRRAERNLGKYWSNDLKFSHCASDGLESEATRCVELTTIGGRLPIGSSGGQGARGSAGEPSGCAWSTIKAATTTTSVRPSMAFSWPLPPTRPRGSASGSASLTGAARGFGLGWAAGGSTTARLIRRCSGRR